MNLKKTILLVLSMIILMVISRKVFLQLDLTNDKRHSLSENTLSQIEGLKEPLKIDVFLSDNLPGAYLHFRNELDALLNQLKFYNDNIIIHYNNPFDFGSSDNVIKEMQKYGMQPEIVVENKNGNRKETYIFPWLIINYNERSERVQLLQKQLGDSENEKIIRSLQQLEYHIIDGIFKVIINQKKNVAVLSSHKTSNNTKIADLLRNLKPYYNLAAFDLKAPTVNSKESLENLSRFDVLVISNPKTIFSQSEKYILDQYELSGGKILWLVNGIGIDRDSLFNNSGETISFPQELNLNDYLFKKGIRVQKILIQDLYCAPIVLANNNENNTQYVPYPWVYYPLPEPELTSIGKNVGSVLIQFASSIDTLSNPFKKTLLLKSSKFTKTLAALSTVKLEDATKKIKPTSFSEGSKAIGYLVQGKQKSLFYNRIKPFENEKHLNMGKIEMIFFSDGNLAENQNDKGKPLALGYDKWTNNFYANRDLIMNSIHFLSGNKDRLAIRNKSMKFAVLDINKIKENLIFWKWFIFLGSIFIVFSISLINQVMRSKHLLK